MTAARPGPRRSIGALLLAGTIAGCTSVLPSPPSSTAVPSPSPSIAPSTGAASPSPGELDGDGTRIGAAWRHVPVTTDSPSARLTAVVLGPGGFAAVGSDEAGAFLGASANGEIWQISRLPGASGNYAAAVAASGNRIVAGGSTSGCCGIDGRALLWLSEGDLSTWRPIGNLPNAGNSGISAIAPWKTGFVAVGIRNATEGSQDGIAWTSEDGRSWRRVAQPSGFNGAWLTDVATSADTIVVIGQIDPNSGPTKTWVSKDAVHWTTTPSSAAIKGVMRAVSHVQDGWISAGFVPTDSGGDPALWTSADGLRWTRINLVRPADSGSVEAFDVAESQAGLVAVGADGSPDSSDSMGLIWFSPDGRSWQPIATGNVFAGQSGGNGVAAVAAASDRLVVVGGTGSPDAVMAAAWISPP